MKEKQKGGPRKGSGRKPSSNPKEPITVFVETQTVQLYGGKDGIRLAIYGFLKSDDSPGLLSEARKEIRTIKIKDLNKLTASPELQEERQLAPETQAAGYPKPSLETFPMRQIHAGEIEKQIAEIKAEKIPRERDTAFGRKAWQLDQDKRIQELKNQLNEK